MTGLHRRAPRPPSARTSSSRPGLADRYAAHRLADRAAVRGLERPRRRLVDSATDDSTTSPPATAATHRPTGLPRPTPCRRASPTRSSAGSTATGGCASTSTCAATRDFEQDVWRKALEIPRGEVRPYGWIAAEIGRPQGGPGGRDGARPQPGPAHRAVPPGRPDRRHRSASTRSAARRTSGRSSPPRASTPTRWRTPRGVASGSSAAPSTHIVCWPTCHTGRRMLPRNRRPFRSLADAADGRLPAVQGLPTRGGAAAA